MNVRERVEEQEYQILSPLAAKSREARRKHPMEECDFRTKFQRDRVKHRYFWILREIIIVPV